MAKKFLLLKATFLMFLSSAISQCPNLYFSGQQAGSMKELKDTAATLLARITEIEESMRTNRQQCESYSPLGTQANPASSCKEIFEQAPLYQTPGNRPYWIKADDGRAVQLFCDMSKGGWTLIGQIGGRVGDIYSTWLVKNHNVDLLKRPNIEAKTYGCVGARKMAVHKANKIRFSSGESDEGMGKYWVEWPLPEGRETATLWNHGITQQKVQTAQDFNITVVAWDGKTGTCFQNKYGIMKLREHGGSYPAVTYDMRGNSNFRDLCMGVGVMTQGPTRDVHGWTQNGNGYDSTQNNVDWPNYSYSHQSPYLSVWLY